MIYSVEHVESAYHILGIVCEAFMASIVASWLWGLHLKAADLSGGVLCWVLGRILVHEYYPGYGISILYLY